jgi:hypothetical protein
MGFQEIEHYYLEQNQEYKINDSYRGIFKGYRMLTVYYPVPDYEEYLEFHDVRTLQNKTVSKHLFEKTDSFSYFFSEKKEIQMCMEYRAINIVLRKITGDDTFLWF